MSTGVHHVEERGVFQCCTKLENVRLPESLRKIGVNAFCGCMALMHMDIPAGVNEIASGAFRGCKSLQTLTLPEGMAELPNSIFMRCSSLKSIKLPSSLRKIGRSAFYECSSLTMINFAASQGKTEIGVLAFYNCSSLVAINFEALKGPVEIGHYAFKKCCSLTTLKLPPLLKTISKFTFTNCESLSKVELPSSLETIEYLAFQDCHPDLTIDLPETVTNIGFEALKGCRIRLPTSLSMLTNEGDTRFLLNDIQEVVMSSRVNLELLTSYICGLPASYYFDSLNEVRRYDDVVALIPDMPFLNPNLKFKILYGGNTCAVPAKIEEHVPESFFSLDISLAHLMSLRDIVPLHEKVHTIFKRKLVIFSEILQCSKVKVHETLLYRILPFLWGGKISEGVLKGVVAEIGRLLSEPKIVSTNKKVRELEDDNRRMKEDHKKMTEKIHNMEKEHVEEMNALKEEIKEIKALLASDSCGGKRKRGQKM